MGSSYVEEKIFFLQTRTYTKVSRLKSVCTKCAHSYAFFNLGLEFSDEDHIFLTNRNPTARTRGFDPTILRFRLSPRFNRYTIKKNMFVLYKIRTQGNQHPYLDPPLDWCKNENEVDVCFFEN